MKRFIIFTLALSIILPCLTYTAYTADERIFSDPVANTYRGRTEGSAMISNLDFEDVPGDHWAKDPITRTGALNLVKGYDRRYIPDQAVTNQEAIAFVLRSLGLEKNAQDTAATLVNQLPANSPLRTAWYIGYINLAMQMGLLTPAQYNDALAADQSALDPAVNFARERPATRENIANWLVRGLETINQELFNTIATRQSLISYSDWDSVAVDKARAVEVLSANNILTGSNGLFLPKGSMTRAEFAQMLKNMDNIYYTLQSARKKTGTVGGVRDTQQTRTNSAALWRNVYVRTDDGSVDILQYSINQSSSPQSGDMDAVTLKDGQVTGLANLEEGDEIEYIVQPSINTVLYVQVLSSVMEESTVAGKLKSVDLTAKTLTITDSNGKDFVYSVAGGLFGTDGDTNYVVINSRRRDASRLPIGSSVELALRNDVVTGITYLGEPSVITEIRGIVIENNTDYGYLTVIDNNGYELTKSFYTDDLMVYKTQYYETDDIGYISQVFPNFKYNPRETSITEIEPGDIVFIRPDPEEPDNIVSISASTNYNTRYGKIKEFRINGEISSMLIEYENKQTSWFDLANDIFISKEGRPISYQDIQAGDWARVLLNQAIISPGYLMESVKELTIEGDGHHISSIVKGQLSGLNSVQKQLVVQNAQTLNKTGWADYKQLQQYSISGKDIEYYLDGKRISLDYAVKNLKRSNGEVYIALENNYSGEQVKKVTFRSGRDELLPADTVINADGNGNFGILGTNGAISTDEGTIVRRHGRLVDGHNIMIPDYAVVSLNGGNKAAVVDITDTPGTSGVMIARGRILSIDEGKSFKVQSMSLLAAGAWDYTPVQREFTIDYNTLFTTFTTLSGYGSIDSFIGYTEETSIDKVYTIVIDGGRAARILDAPYANRAVRGVIYSLFDGVADIRNAEYYNNATGRWMPVSNTNATISVTVQKNSVVAKNNTVVEYSGLQVGDQIRVMTDSLPDRITGGISITGYIIQVEK